MLKAGGMCSSSRLCETLHIGFYKYSVQDTACNFDSSLVLKDFLAISIVSDIDRHIRLSLKYEVILLYNK